MLICDDMTFRRVFLALLISIATVACTWAQKEPRVIKDIEFAQGLGLDLYLPNGETLDGLVVWIHGGAWRAGSKEKVPVLDLVDRGWPIASVDYRLSGEAQFPAQIHDIKGAIRFLRSQESEYGYRAENVFAIGSSAGGHLVALTGVTNGHAALEGSVGSHLKESSDVQGIVSLYGASNLTTILDQSTPHGLSVRVPALELFIGGRPENVTETARLASPVFHVDRDDPPLLMIHGDQDPQMPINQSLELESAYGRVSAPVEFISLNGAKHGGGAFYDAERIGIMHRFLASVVAER